MLNNFSKCREWVPRGTSQHKWRWLTTLLLILTLGIGQMWAEDVTWEGPYGNFVSKKLSDGKTEVTITKDASNSSKTISCIASGNQAYQSINGGGKYIKFAVPDGYTITNIKMVWMSGANEQALPVLFGESISSVGTVEGKDKAVTITNGGFIMTDEIATSAATNCESEDDIALPSGTKQVMIGRSGAYSSANYTIGDVEATVKFRLAGASGSYFTAAVGKESTPFIGRVVLTVTANCTKPGTPGTPSVSSKTHNTANLTWTAADNSDGYKVSIVKKSDASVIVDWTNCATNSYAASGLSPETTYTFKVKAKGATGYCDLGDEASADFTTEVDPSATTYKVTLVPAGGTISDATGWTLNAGNYEKEVSDGTELTLPTFTKANRTFKTWRNGAVDVTSPITVTGDVTLTAVWNATIENVIYSWEGAEGGATETGGTATGSVDGLINVAKSGYYCLQINGNTSYDKYVQITLSGEEKVKTGDKIRYTGFYTNTGTKNAAVKMRASGGTAIFTGANLPRIEEASPRTDTYVVPEGINTASVQITRHQTQTSSFLTKLQIIRPTLVEEANLRTVTFNYNDGVTANVTVEVASGSKVSAPADPTRAHYRFHEWQLGGVAYDFATAVTADITLVADWTQLYTVTYAKGEESATGDAPTQDELAAGENFTVAANPFAYEGHDFSTWNDGSADVAPGTEYTMGAANVTLTAQWITATTKVTVTYKDGETTLGSEEITINTGNPVGYATYQTRNLATFDGWYNDPDLAEGHKIADISALTASANVNVYGKWNYKYASSTNIEQWTLTNGAGKGSTTKTSALISLLGTNNFASNLVWENGNIELDSLDDAKGDRNEPYLGLKVKSGGKMLDFRVANGQTVKVKFGAIKSTLPQVSINGGEYENMTLTEKVWSYTATGNDYISIKTADANAVVFKQIMINEDIAAVTLPWRVTYNANGGTCATAEAIWSGSALILPNVTPAEPADYTFAGWYDEETGGELKGVAGASYTPTDNETLFAHFAPVEYAVNYAAGDHGSGDMAAANVGWGTVYTAVANGFTPETGYIFAGWTVSGVDGVSSIAAGGSFTMPKNEVTLTALWEDVSKVAVIVETNVKYESLANAVAAATDGQTIQLLQNNNVTAQVEVAGKAITLDLAGYKIEYTGTSTLPSGVILVHNGASLTIDDSSDPDAGSIVSGADAYAAIALTKAGDDATNPAVLVINGGIFTGYYYAITGNGSRHNTEITINAGTFTGTAANDNSAIYHPQQGTLIINGGTFTGYSAAIELRAGTLEINDGTFTATATEYSCNPSGSGTTTVGAAVAIAQHNTQKDIAVTINGGTFEGVKAINEANPQGNPAPAVAMSVTGGDFTGEVSTVDVHEFISGGTYDAAVANENCATGWVPAPADPVTGKYTVEPKDGVCLVKITPTSQTKGTQTGLYPDGDELTINLSSGMNLGGSGKYIGVKATENFQEGDVLHLNMSTYQNNQNATAYVYADKDASVFLFDTEEKCDENKDYYITMPAAVNGHNELYIVRTEGNKWNGGPSVMEVTRAMKPMLTAITIDGRDGVIDEVNKTVAVQVPYEANLAALTVVPTIVWNEAAASNSIVVNDGSAWIEGANTYKLTDKDGDYTVYTITLTRDVLKHTVSYNTHGGSAVASELVEDGDYLAAAPADPTKEDYIFQYWSETEDGAEVDVTTIQINADKEFHAVWAPDGGIKLINKTSGAVNEDGYFITGVTATEANSEKAAAWGGTQGTSISGVNALGKIVQYNATTNQTKLQIKVYNTNNSDKYVYIHKIIEGNNTEETVETLTATSKTVVTSEFYEFNDTKNRSFYLTTNSTDVKILQVKVIDDGATPMKQAGEAGYSLNLNKGRVVYYANADVAFEGLALNSASNYSVISSSEFQTTKNFSFSISSPVLLKVTTNTAKYYVSQDPDEDGTTATAVTDAGTAEFNLTTTGTWYLVPSTTSNVKYTNIAFELPKAATPVIETQPATNHTFDPGDMTATVVATVTEGTLHYQWYKKATVGDDEEVGTDAATLTTTTEGTYYVVVTNTLAGHQDVSVTSEEAELGYRVTNDATLMALSYGGTAITLEDGVYNYNVELAKGTTDVPALSATATMDGYADVDINDAAEFVNYEASSTVTVKSEDLTETNVYTVNFYVKHDLPQVDVTATTTWDMTNVSADHIELTGSDKDTRLLLANIDGVNNNASFNSQALMFEGQHIGRTGAGVKHLAGRYVQFNVTVPGAVFVTFESNGDNARTIAINGKKCSRTTSGTAADKYITYAMAVEPGSVEIMGYEGESANKYVRISKIEFKAEASHTRSGLNPSFLGTLCWTNNAILGGATLYEFAGKDEYNKLVFDEVAENRLEAGKPYIFMPENGNTEIKLYNTDAEAALTEDQAPVNHMYGTIVGKTLVPGEDDNMYYFSSNHIWAVKDFSVNINVPAYYCYVDYPAVLADAPAPAPAPGRRRVTMGVNGQNTATGMENLNSSDKPVKLLINGQIFILRGEKLFDATGRLVK